MCNQACINFGRTHLTRHDVEGKTVLEVGALDVNGSLRSIVEALRPARYVGVDIKEGPGVDEICDANELVIHFGSEAFDVLITTELLEHVRDWRAVMSNFKSVLKPYGVLVITTRSRGYGYHGYPHDFWRYEAEDVKAILSDFCLEVIEKDSLSPGVFVRARKPLGWQERKTTIRPLYSIIRNKHVEKITTLDLIWFKVCYATRRALSQILPGPIKRFLKARILRNQ